MSTVDRNRAQARSAAKFWDRIAERYAGRPVADEAAYQRKLQITRGYLRPDMDLLEIGCGTGSTAIAHAPFVNRILATDISPGMLEIARGKAAADGIANVAFECVSVEDLEAPAASFDAVLALNVLHLIEDRDAAIAKVARLLRPGGVFVSDTACIGDGMKWFRLVAPVGRALGLMPLVKVFSRKSLEESLVRHGFMIEYGWRPGKNPAVFIIAGKAG